MNKIEKIEQNKNLKYVNGKYKNVHSVLIWTCNVCGEKFEESSFKAENRGCKSCNKRRREEEIENQKNSLDKIRIEKITDDIQKRNLKLIDYYRNKHNALILVLYNCNRDRYGNDYGEYEQDYYMFLRGCIDDRENKDNFAKTTEEWIKKAKEIHSEYTFENVIYKNKNKPVIITCPKHGDFPIYPPVFLRSGCKCPSCRSEKIHEETVKRNIEKIKNLVEKYDIKLDESSFIDDRKSVVLILPNGEQIKRIPHNLHKIDFQKMLNSKKKEKIKKENSKTKEERKDLFLKKRQASFFERVIKIHPNLDFSKTVYNRTHDDVIVTCHELNEFGEEHGDFSISPHNLLAGYGCKKCSNCFLDREYFIKKANKKHDNKYDYSKVVYINNYTDVTITCPEHGDFTIKPYSHLNGQGCSLCKTSHLEREFEIFLKEHNISYIYQYRRKEIFGQQSLDFYINNGSIGIECQGEQHFVANFFKSKGIEYAKEHLEYIQSLDKRKKNICKENGIRLIYFVDKKFVKYLEDGDEYITDKEDLIEILNGNKQPNIK